MGQVLSVEHPTAACDQLVGVVQRRGQRRLHQGRAAGVEDGDGVDDVAIGWGADDHGVGAGRQGIVIDGPGADLTGPLAGRRTGVRAHGDDRRADGRRGQRMDDRGGTGSGEGEIHGGTVPPSALASAPMGEQRADETVIDGELNGVVVVDLSTSLSGAYAAKMFADSGATVTRVEPAGGDPQRRAQWSGEPHADTAPLFRYLRHGQRSVTVHANAHVSPLARASR